MLSACIIAKNEEKYIANCLSSLVNYVDEIILVDTGSHDNTVAIARQYRCNIYYYNWNDDFSAARNYSIAQAKGNFILYIDADETLQNCDELLSITQNTKSNIGGFFVDVISYSPKKQSAVSKQVRLFKNHLNFKFSGRIHEQIGDSILKAGYEITNSSIIINHYGYEIDSNELRNKYFRNLRLIDLELENSNSNYYTIHKARTLAALNRYNEAVNLLKNILNSILEQTEQCEVLNLIAGIYIAIKENHLAIYYFEKSLEINNRQSNVINQLSNIYYYIKQYDKALHYIELLENINKSSNSYKVINPQELIFKKSKLLLLLEKYDKALDFLEFNYSLISKDTDSLYLLANAYFKNSHYEKSLDILRKIKRINADFRDINELIYKIENHINNSAMNNILITLCMIVKNEEKYLAGCLDSVQNIADEIIIIDTGSSDKTLEIAQKYTNNIHYFQWINDFSMARNESLKYAKGKWILYLDADERLILHNPNSFKELLINADDNIGAINCIIESKIVNKFGNSEIERGNYPRIFRNYGYPNIKFEGKVHEQIINSIERLGKSTINTDIIINHLGYDTSENIIKDKSSRNLELLLQNNAENPNDGYTLFQLAQTYLMKEEYKIAFEYFHKALIAPNLSQSLKANVYSTLAQFAGIEGDFYKAIDLAKQSLEITKNQELAWAILADGFTKINKIEEAIQAYKVLLDYKRNGKQFLEIGFDKNIDESKIERIIQNLEKKLRS